MWSALLVGMLAVGALDNAPQYVLLNMTPGRAWHDSRPATLAPAHLDDLRAKLPLGGDGPRQIGLSYIFSYFNNRSPATFEASLDQCLATARQLRAPVLITLDGECWWGARPDLWNWWDPTLPGYNDANRANVEWAGPGPEYAVKLGWRNWGRQLRVLPQPNLLSPAYRAATHVQLEHWVPRLVAWWRALPPEDADLFVGLKLGWESSIGVQAWYYPNGNDLFAADPAADPTTGLDHAQRPARGVVALGWAAATAGGLLGPDGLTEAVQAEIVRRHLADWCARARAMGLPRELIYTHTAGWAQGDLYYGAALNPDSCPGWSFYAHAANPAADPDVAAALAASDAPSWAAVEWLLPGGDGPAWQAALERTLDAPGCRFVCIYNWESIAERPDLLAAVRAVAEGGGP